MIPPSTSTDIPTLRSLLTKPSTSPNVFVALNNANYLSSALSTPLSRLHELDWWDERILRVPLPSNADGPAVNAEVRLSCTPSQHMSARTATDRGRALLSSWAVEDLRSLKKLYFAGDTGYRTVNDGEDEDNVPVCPAFAEIGERFGGFDVALLPIGCVSQCFLKTLSYVFYDLTWPGVLAHITHALSCPACMPHPQIRYAFSRT